MKQYKPSGIEFGLNTITGTFLENLDPQIAKWSAFILHTGESMHRTLGHTEHGIFHFDDWIKSFNVFTRLADYLRYEFNAGRKTIVCFPSHINWDDDMMPNLIQYWADKGFRETDPRYIVHSTTIECGENILKDGKLKCFRKLKEEGYFNSKRLGHSQLGEPEDFKEHINFAPWKSIWAEVVVSSNQKKRFVTPDEEYEPGYRFYFDAVKIANNNKLLRTGNGIPASHDILDLEPYMISYETAKSLCQFTKDKWTPNSFTEIANRRFEDIVLSGGEKN